MPARHVTKAAHLVLLLEVIDTLLLVPNGLIALPNLLLQPGNVLLQTADGLQQHHGLGDSVNYN